MTPSPQRPARLGYAIALLAVLLVGMATPTVAATVVARARNADAVDHLSAVRSTASLNKRRGRLVATDKHSGLLPNDIISKAPDSDLLDGLDSSTFARASAVHHDQASCSNDGFVAENSTSASNYSAGLRYSSTGGNFGCSLSLPVGATMRSFTVDVYDNAGAGTNVECVLREDSIDGGAVFDQPDATVSTTGTPGLVTRTTTTLTRPIVGANVSYSAVCALAAGVSTGVIGARVAYDLPVATGTTVP